MKKTNAIKFGKSILLTLVILTIGIPLITVFPMLVSAQPNQSSNTPLLAIEPENYTASHKGETFNVNITISKLNASSRLIGVNFRLHYNIFCLEAIEIKNGNVFEPYAEPPNSTGMYYIFYPPESGLNTVQIGILLLPDDNGIWHSPFPRGNGTLCTVTFKVIGGPPCKHKLRMSWTLLIDPENNEIPHTLGEPSSFDLIEVLHHSVTYTSFNYPVVTVSNSSVSPIKTLMRSNDLGLLRFNVSGEWPNATQFCNITIPRELLHSNFSLKIDGNSTLFNSWQNSTHSTLHFEYDAGAHQIEIAGETVLPKLTEDISLDVEVDVGKMHYRGELAEFYALTTFKGTAVNVTITKATLYYSDGTMSMDLTEYMEQISTGLYRVPYEIPLDASTGTYTLLIEATYGLPMMIDETVLEVDTHGTSFKTFLISPLLTFEQAQISAIEEDIATILIPTIGLIKTNLTAINAELVNVNSNLATISSTLGTIQADLEAIDLKVTNINGTVATINTILGQIEGKVTSIENNVATIVTDIGTIEADISNIEGTQEDIEGTQATLTISLYVAVVLALIAAVGTIAVIVISQKS